MATQPMKQVAGFGWGGPKTNMSISKMTPCWKRDTFERNPSFLGIYVRFLGFLRGVVFFSSPRMSKKNRVEKLEFYLGGCNMFYFHPYGEMIQLDLRIFFRWVGKKPPISYHPSIKSPPNKSLAHGNQRGPPQMPSPPRNSRPY